MIAQLLKQTGVRSARLELEITEGVFLAEGDSTDETFARLKGLGVRLALDDFGTGYSSLGYLKKAPFDKIKIDQSFVRGAASTTNRNSAIIRAIVTLAETLGMDTTAEGVETHDDLHLIRELGVSQVQGYIFGRPAPAEEARAAGQPGDSRSRRLPVHPRAAAAADAPGDRRDRRRGDRDPPAQYLRHGRAGRMRAARSRRAPRSPSTSSASARSSARSAGRSRASSEFSSPTRSTSPASLPRRSAEQGHHAAPVVHRPKGRVQRPPVSLSTSRRNQSCLTNVNSQAR